VLVASLTLATTAEAKWGTYSECGIKSKPVNEHCYSLAVTLTHKLGSIAADDNEVANVADWQNGAFYDQEQWVSWPNAGGNEKTGWVEAGITEGEGRTCCVAYPFVATETQTGAYHEREAEGPVESGSGAYNYTLIQDTEQNGVYHVYWSAATNTANWFEVAQYGGGRPVYIEKVEGGLEVASEDNPYHAGRDEVALTNGGSWSAWPEAQWFANAGICMNNNRENSSTGNIEWDPGHNECLERG
jgi:hypothetical protein